MKRIIILTIVIALMGISYFIGYQTAPQVNQSDWVLAYEHWYETSSVMLQNDSLLNNKALRKDLILAQSEIDSVYHSQVMQWPVVCDQRDMLSDAIRCYLDNNPESDLLDYVIDFGTDPRKLCLWSYSY